MQLKSSLEKLSNVVNKIANSNVFKSFNYTTLGGENDSEISARSKRRRDDDTAHLAAEPQIQLAGRLQVIRIRAAKLRVFKATGVQHK